VFGLRDALREWIRGATHEKFVVVEDVAGGTTLEKKLTLPRLKRAMIIEERFGDIEFGVFEYHSIKDGNEIPERHVVLQQDLVVKYIPPVILEREAIFRFRNLTAVTKRLEFTAFYVTYPVEVFRAETEAAKKGV